jgi:hypothetical protein
LFLLAAMASWGCTTRYDLVFFPCAFDNAAIAAGEEAALAFCIEEGVPKIAQIEVLAPANVPVAASISVPVATDECEAGSAKVIARFVPLSNAAHRVIIKVTGPGAFDYGVGRFDIAASNDCRPRRSDY